MTKVQNLRWSNHYGAEGSGFGYLMFSLDRKLGHDYPDINFGYRVILRKYLSTILFDGQIRKITENQADRDKIEITALGWNVLFEDDVYNAVYSDTRLNRWEGSEEPSGSFRPDAFDYDLQDRIRLKPRRGMDYTANDYTHVRYTMPTGEAVKRFRASWKLELPYSWPGKLEVLTSTGEVLLSETATGSGTLDKLTTGDPSYVEIRFYCTANGENTATGDTVYGELTDVEVLGAEDEVVDGSVVAADLVAVLASSVHGLSSDTSKLKPPNRALSPAVFESDQTPAEIMRWLCQFGDNQGRPLAWGVEMNDLRRAFLETQDLTTIRYVVRRSAPIQGQVTGDWTQSHQRMYAVYTDTEGQEQRTADAYNQEAIDELGGYYRRTALRVDGATDETQALYAVALALAEKGKPVVSSSFKARGHIYDANLKRLPVDEIKAGGLTRVREFRAREATLSTNDFRDSHTTFMLVGAEIDADRQEARLIPAGDRGTFERYMARLAAMREE